MDEKVQLRGLVNMPEPAAPAKPSRLKIVELLRPHWKALVLALAAVIGETATDLLEPWPLKIIVDNLLQSRNCRDGWPG